VPVSSVRSCPLASFYGETEGDDDPDDDQRNTEIRPVIHSGRSRVAPVMDEVYELGVLRVIDDVDGVSHVPVRLPKVARGGNDRFAGPIGEPNFQGSPSAIGSVEAKLAADDFAAVVTP
jgi:hypothetical protein